MNLQGSMCFNTKNSQITTFALPTHLWQKLLNREGYIKQKQRKARLEKHQRKSILFFHSLLNYAFSQHHVWQVSITTYKDIISKRSHSSSSSDPN